MEQYLDIIKQRKEQLPGIKAAIIHQFSVHYVRWILRQAQLHSISNKLNESERFIVQW